MLTEFSKKNSFTGEESLIFEKLANYCLLANDYYDSYNIENMCIGDCIGIDTVAISINGVLIYSEKEAIKYCNGQFDCKFIFIQTKTSSKLDLGDYLKFLNTIFIFFKYDIEKQPDELKKAFKIKSYIYEKTTKFRLHPVLEINYVYTGSGNIEDKNFKNQVDSILNGIKNIPYAFSDVNNILIGDLELSAKYKETLNRTKKLYFFIGT